MNANELSAILKQHKVTVYKPQQAEGAWDVKVTLPTPLATKKHVPTRDAKGAVVMEQYTTTSGNIRTRPVMQDVDITATVQRFRIRPSHDHGGCIRGRSVEIIDRYGIPRTRNDAMSTGDLVGIAETISSALTFFEEGHDNSLPAEVVMSALELMYVPRPVHGTRNANAAEAMNTLLGQPAPVEDQSAGEDGTGDQREW